MKLSSTLSLLVPLLSVLPACHALIGANWSMSNVPPEGMLDIYFPLTIVDTDRATGYFFAQQFSFVGTNDVGLIGIQPRPSDGGEGEPVFRAVFASYIQGTTSNDKNCAPAADGGSGVSCSADWNGVYGRKYEMQVTIAGERMWMGSVNDTETGELVDIGTFTLPADIEGIKDSQVGFVEWYPWNGDSSHQCNSLPYQQSIFGTPTTGMNVGTQGLAYEYGDCVGQVDFSTSEVEDGVSNNCGFRQ